MQPLQASQAEVTRSLQNALDAASWDLKQWTASLPFIVRNPTDLPGGAANFATEGLCHNILEYLKPMYKGYKIYFSSKYNNQQPHLAFGGDSGWKDLLKDIEIAGMQAGFYPVSNGGNCSKRIMICRGSRLYQGKKERNTVPVNRIIGMKPSIRIATILEEIRGNFSLGRRGRHVHSTGMFHVLSASTSVSMTSDITLSVVQDVLIMHTTQKYQT